LFCFLNKLRKEESIIFTSFLVLGS